MHETRLWRKYAIVRSHTCKGPPVSRVSSGLYIWSLASIFMAFTEAFVSNGLLGGASSDGDSPFGSHDMEFTSNGLLGGSTPEDKAMLVEAADEGSNSDGMLLDEGFISNGLLGGVNAPGAGCLCMP